MGLSTKDTDPKVQRKQPHRKQCERARTFGARVRKAQAFFINKIRDHEGWQRCNSEEKEAVEIQGEVCKVITPRFRSIQLGALSRRRGEDIVLDDVPGNDCGLSVSEGINSYDRNLISSGGGRGQRGKTLMLDRD